MENQKYSGINGLRAISIILVVIYHLTYQDKIFHGLYEIRWLLPVVSFLQDGHLGVNIFFVISGFLITSLLLREELKTKTISLKNFYIRRTLRIFPAYYFLLLVYFFLQQLGVFELSATSWITSLTYTKYFNWEKDWLTSHAWSLSIEEHFYLFWPLFFMAGDKFRKIAAIVLIASVPFMRVYFDYHDLSEHYALTLFTRIDAIATGCLFALYRNKIIEKISPWWNPVFIVSSFLLISLRYFPLLATKIHLEFIFVPLGTTHGTIANFLIAIILMYSVFGPNGIWSKFLNWKLLNYVGLLSYSIYLWQQIFISGLDYWPAKFPQNIFCVLAMALFSYHLLEKPFLKLKSKFSII